METHGTTCQLGHISTLYRELLRKTSTEENSSTYVLSSVETTGHCGPGMLETWWVELICWIFNSTWTAAYGSSSGACPKYKWIEQTSIRPNLRPHFAPVLLPLWWSDPKHWPVLETCWDHKPSAPTPDQGTWNLNFTHLPWESVPSVSTGQASSLGS